MGIRESLSTCVYFPPSFHCNSGVANGVDDDDTYEGRREEEEEDEEGMF